MFRRRKEDNIIRAKKGNKEAFINLIEENLISMYRVAKGILLSQEDIDDAIQNTILLSYKNINTLKKNEFFKTWLIRILINAIKFIILIKSILILMKLKRIILMMNMKILI